MAIKSQAFYLGKNALGLYDYREGDSNLLGGFDLDPGFSGSINDVSGSVSGAVQTVITDNRLVGVMSKPILFPFPIINFDGHTVIASADFSAATVRFVVGVRFLDANKEHISRSTSDYIASGRRHHEAFIDLGTVYIQWFTAREDDTAADGGQWSFTRPALRINGTTFTP